MRCSECGQLIALRYKIGEEDHVYTFQKFKQYRKEIEGGEDSKYAPKGGEYMRNVPFGEFDDLLYLSKFDEDELFPIQEGGEGVFTDYESEDPERLRQTEDLEEYTY